MTKLIFVCHGNICRSPASDYIFKKIVKDLELEDKYESYSRALTTEEMGNDIYPPMKLALNKANIPYQYHQARLLDDLDIQWADYIVYMDEENKWLIDNYFHINKNKLIYLAKYNDNQEISDPWYHHGFDGCLKQLYNAILKLIKELEKNNKK